PPPDLPVHLFPFWPWIWFQRLMLKRWVRETYGKGTPFRWTVNFYGDVILLEVCDPRARRKTPDWLTPPPHPNKRIAAALSGELMQPLSLGRGVGVRGQGIAAMGAFACAAISSPLIPNLFSPGRRGYSLPLPEP
ncbi:MAG: hypothetical protein KDA53_05425, partial [Hyphomonas sp.]|nr:hypothetical protein [Hyphomonas sp.]